MQQIPLSNCKVKTCGHKPNAALRNELLDALAINYKSSRESGLAMLGQSIIEKIRRGKRPFYYRVGFLRVAIAN